MTIAIDEVITSAGGQGAVNTITFTKVGNTSPTGLTILFTPLSNSTDLAPTSVTYDGVAISVSSFIFVSGGSTFKGYYGSIIPPNSGQKDLVFNFSDLNFKNLFLSATFWSGDIDSVNYYTRALASADPVISIAKAASSAITGFVFDSQGGSTMTFLGDGTERTLIAPYYAATQEPAQGSGVMDWKESTFEGDFSHTTAYVAAEIIATAAAATMGGTFQLMFGR